MIRTMSRSLVLNAALLLVFAGSLGAQSIVAGTVAGAVTDRYGSAMRGVYVTLREVGTGIGRSLETPRSGRFEFAFVVPGRYELLAERLGEQPVRVEGIHVGPGARVRVPVRLMPAEPPVTQIDVVRLGAVQKSGSGGSRRFSTLELHRLPHDIREIAELGRLSSSSTGQLGSEGLPGQFAGVVVDGVAYQGSHHAGLAQPLLPTGPFVLSSFEGLELIGNPIDVEYAGAAAATLAGFTRRGTSQLEVSAFGDWYGDALVSSGHFEPGNVSLSSLRGGAIISGPLVRDTAHFVIGVEGRWSEMPQPRSWEQTELDAALAGIASDSFDTDVSPYLGPRASATDILSVFGRVDWRFGSGTSLAVRANGSNIKAVDPILGAYHARPFGATVDGTDLSGTASLTTTLSPTMGLELRVGAELSRREYATTDIPHTVLVEIPVAFGTDPVLPGDFQRFAIRANETMHYRSGVHNVKIGIAATISSNDNNYSPGGTGQYFFSGTDDFATMNGYFVQSVGQPHSAKYTSTELGFFVQDIWMAAPGLELTGGLRVDVEFAPWDDVVQNETWFETTGLERADTSSSIVKLSPRFGFLWDIGERGTWQVSGAFGIHHGSIGATSLAELFTNDGSFRVRRGIGTLAGWPGVPDSTAAPVLGPRVTLFGPDFVPPRSTRASFGISTRLGSLGTLHLKAAYRHTDFLPRRHDINRLPSPVAVDQYGRSLYGELVQSGGALAATPNSNRRFDDFDVVSALDADGYSDYMGITASLERRVSETLQLFASYTYSNTEDNWLSGLGGGYEMQLTPFPSGVGGVDWAEGRSNFDQPHRFTVGAELDFGAIRLAGFFRTESGMPFTPGFRPGVDANGDGSALNDPAFVDTEVAGISDLVSRWDCLRGQNNSFADRNSCRGASLKTLDLRLSIQPLHVGQYPVQLFVDGLNLLDTDVAGLDRALYLVDPDGSLAVDAGTGTVTVPLIANPNFGEPVVRRGFGRVIRIGMRVNHD